MNQAFSLAISISDLSDARINSSPARREAASRLHPNRLHPTAPCRRRDDPPAPPPRFQPLNSMPDQRSIQWRVIPIVHFPLCTLHLEASQRDEIKSAQG